MESNYTDKIEEIKKMLGGWFLRYLTPYGKITVIKSLALSKLSRLFNLQFSIKTDISGGLIFGSFFVH